MSVSEARRRVFCSSLADVFDNEVDPQWRRDLFALIEATPNLDWLLLTKRVGNVTPMMKTCGYAYGADTGNLISMPRNIWMGITVVNQDEADRDIPKLLQIPARVRFLSVEPMLGAIDICNGRANRWSMPTAIDSAGRGIEWTDPGSAYIPVDWVICGGESGKDARPMHPDWARSLRDQCTAAGVPYLFKQWGEWEPRNEWSGYLGNGRFEPMTAIMKDGSPCPFDAVPEEVGAHRMARVGKKAAGRLLDCREHSEFPQVAK